MAPTENGIRRQAHPRWTLVTVSYNSAGSLERYWSNVEHRDDVEWIVVDNSSRDGSREVAARLGARVIPLQENRGFGGANNVGFRASTSEYVCFVNPDVTPVLSDLPTLESVVDANPRSIVAPQLVNHDGTLQPNGRGEPRLMSKILHRVSPERVSGTYRLFADAGEVTDVGWLTGAVVAGRRDWLGHLGPWDEHFFVYYEDTDLGLRNALAQGRSILVGDARWTHGWARATAELNVGALRREIASMVKFYRRYPRLLGVQADRG
jgi:GT2 family glycosyltransferase